MEITDSLLNELIRLYEKGLTYKKISEEVKILKPGKISKILKEKGFKNRGASISNRKYSVNDTFFDNIDSEEKAYFLGIIYADGYLSKTKYGGSIIIQLKLTDIEILEKLKNSISYTGKIHIRQRNPKWKGSYPNSYTSARLEITNKHIFQRLTEIGLTQNKTEDCKYPYDIINKKYQKDFIRGYFDGDGSVFKTSDGKWRCSICGTEDFLKGIMKYFSKEFRIKSRHPDRESNNRYYSFGKKDDVKSFLNTIYEGSSIYLERKFNKYKEFMSLYDVSHIEQDGELRENA